MLIVSEKGAVHPADFGCAQAGCAECLNRLLKQYEGLIHWAAMRQAGGEMDFVDVIQEGRIALASDHGV